jgi:hypothetical protein
MAVVLGSRPGKNFAGSELIYSLLIYSPVDFGVAGCESNSSAIQC